MFGGKLFLYQHTRKSGSTRRNGPRIRKHAAASLEYNKRRVACLPNKPECAYFASILRHLLLRAISTQPCYVRTLCVEFALIIRVCKFAQTQRMRQRMRRIYAKKNCVQKKKLQKKIRARIRTRDFYSEVRYSNHSATLTSVIRASKFRI